MPEPVEPLGLSALAMARAGWPVFPCRPHGKSPLTGHGFLDATMDEHQIRAWWQRWPQANVAIPTGAQTVDVLDIDVRETGDGWAGFERLKAAGLLAGAVRLVRTPSGGLHVHFPSTGQPCASLKHQFIDFKGNGGYVLVPPSVVTTDCYTGRYVEMDRRENGRPLDWAAVRSLLDPEPQRATGRSSPKASGKLEPLVAWLLDQRPGGRNAALFWAACKALSDGHCDLKALAAAAEAIGLPLFEVESTIQSARRTVARHEC